MPRTFGALVDELVLSATIVLESKRAFCETRPGPPPEFETLIEEVRAAPPVIHWPSARASQRRRIQVELPAVGAKTFIDEHPASTDAADTLVVYHHGLGEIPHDIVPRVFRLISRRLRERCDVIVCKGLHHEAWPEVSLRLTADREVFLRSLVASASLVRAIAKAKREGYKHLIMCGISMGGVISLIEASGEPRYDLYVPFLAGPNLRDVLFESYFTRTVQAGWRKRARKSGWLDRLDLSDRLGGEGPPIRPLLAASDRLFRREAQLASYARVPRAEVKGCRGGHITSAVRVDVLARHLMSTVNDLLWTQPVPVTPRREAVLA